MKGRRRRRRGGNPPIPLIAFSAFKPVYSEAGIVGVCNASQSIYFQ